MSAAQSRLAEFSCDNCQNTVSFPTFGLLCHHTKQEHKSEYIQFRIKKTSQIPFRCQICQFCFPDQKTYDRHNVKKQCQKFKKQYDEYIDSLEDDENSDDESNASTFDSDKEQSNGNTMGSWILCPIITCYCSIQLIDLPDHLKDSHPGFSKVLKSRNYSKYFSVILADDEEKMVENDLLEEDLKVIVAKCPKIGCTTEFNFSKTVWSDIDLHLSTNHELHWLHFKRKNLQNFATSRLVEREGKTVNFSTQLKGEKIDLFPSVTKCQQCDLDLLREEMGSHQEKCQALKCTVKEFTEDKKQKLDTEIMKTFVFQTNKLYL